MILRSFLIFIAFLATNALAQTLPAPPRTVEDILAVLDQYKRDPAAVERLRAAATAKPPDTANRQDLAIFYHKRGRANGLIGNTRQAISDFNKASKYIEDTSFENQNQLEQIDDRSSTLRDLANAEASGGNRLRALDTWKQEIQLAGKKGRSLGVWNSIANTYAMFGDMQSARETMRQADIVFGHLRKTSSDWYIFGHTMTMQNERGHGDLLSLEGNFGEAERRYRRAVEESELFHKANASIVKYNKNAPPLTGSMAVWASSEDALSACLRNQGRLAEAESYARSALVKRLQTYGRYSSSTAPGIVSLGWIVFESGRFADAVKLAQAAIESYEEAGVVPEAIGLAGARSLLGAARVAQSRWGDAIAVFEARDRGLASDEAQYAKYSGRDSNWGVALIHKGDTKKALAMLEEIYRDRLKRGLTDTEYITAQSRGFYAMALAADGQIEKALAEFRGAVPVLLAEARRNSSTEQGGDVAKQMRLVWILEAYMRLLIDHRDSLVIKDAGIDAVAEAFRLADAARGSGVQRALAESAARVTPGDPVLADLARREQDAEQRFVTLSDLLNRLLSLPPEQQLPKIIGELKRDIETLRISRDKLKQDLSQQFPDYTNLIDPKPPTLAEVQQALGNDEALISIYVGSDRTYVWAVPRSGKTAFASVDMTDARIAQSVAQLRRALDVGSVSLAAFPRFDLNLSHELYAELLEPVEQSGGEEQRI